ncbi:MAG: PIN domain-containing protein [Thiothrix sp.]|uniref:type II toxin-antitoxin system VapC family toxin n=1 Tax=Thiothrix sp. TaxID=1032 RepID=UPI002607B76E|nr:PIN domain-containing protein [Thiothrix sp.]MDD5393559.1 PIN domain-containing protein [Thiothrix sp.]
MTRRVLLDTNLLIAALDAGGTTSDEQRTEAKQKLNALLSDATVALAITPLIRYEVLRGIAWDENERYQQLQQILADFEEFDISRDVSELAANLFRFDVNNAKTLKQPRNFEKRKFDVFHLASAQCNALELDSQDTDIAKLYQQYAHYLAEIR